MNNLKTGRYDLDITHNGKDRQLDIIDITSILLYCADL